MTMEVFLNKIALFSINLMIKHIDELPERLLNKGFKAKSYVELRLL
jgi:hypothetical protein